MSQLDYNMILHNKPTLGLEEEMAARHVLRSGWIAQGEEVRAFEDEVCEFIGLQRGHAIAVSSGTAALYLALVALQIKGEKVAYPGYVCSALRNATLLAGGKEVLIDSGKGSPNINLEELVQSKATVGMIPYMFGIPQDVSNTLGNMLIIEDCAQAIGAKVNDSSVGLQGDVGILSFYATKVITSGGQGGMVVSKNKELINNMKDFRHFDEIRDKKQRFNFQMTDLQAAIGRVQLRKLPAFINRREEIYQRYKNAGMNVIDTPDDFIQPVRYRAVVVTNRQHDLLEKLRNNNIMGVIPIRKKEIEVQSKQLQNACSWTKKTVSLPIYPSLTNEQVDRIISIVVEVK